MHLMLTVVVPEFQNPMGGDVPVRSYSCGRGVVNTKSYVFVAKGENKIHIQDIAC